MAIGSAIQKRKTAIGCRIAVSDPTRSLADPGALDRSTNSGLVSLDAAANRLCSKCSSALGRSSDYSTGSSAVDNRHSTCSAEPGRRPVDSKRSSAVEVDTISTIKITVAFSTIALLGCGEIARLCHIAYTLYAGAT